MGIDRVTSSAGPSVPEPVRRFLADLRAAGPAHVGPAIPMPPGPHGALRAVALDADLVARFTTAARSAGAQVHATTRAAVVGVVRDLLGPLPAPSIVIEPSPASACTDETAAALEESLRAAGAATTRQRDDATLFGASASITGVWAAVAETGSVLCTSGARTARGTSLVPPVHVALVAASQIVADLFDVFEQLVAAGQLPANVNFITGPSKTADIEGVLITGVHGPGQVHLVLLTDA